MQIVMLNLIIAASTSVRLPGNKCRCMPAWLCGTRAGNAAYRSSMYERPPPTM